MVSICKDCGQEFLSPSEYKRHQQTHLQTHIDRWSSCNHSNSLLSFSCIYDCRLCSLNDLCSNSNANPKHTPAYKTGAKKGLEAAKAGVYDVGTACAYMMWERFGALYS